MPIIGSSDLELWDQVFAAMSGGTRKITENSRLQDIYIYPLIQLETI